MKGEANIILRRQLEEAAKESDPLVWTSHLLEKLIEALEERPPRNEREYQKILNSFKEFLPGFVSLPDSKENASLMLRQYIARYEESSYEIIHNSSSLPS